MIRVMLAAVILLAAGCGSRTAGSGRTPSGTPEDPGDPYGDSPSYQGDPFAGFGGIVSIAVPGGLVPETPGNSQIITGGFSVQVAACSTPEAAASLVDNLRGLVEQPVFIDVEGGYHKVRAGSFATRDQAMVLQSSLRSLGYTDAWVVER